MKREEIEVKGAPQWGEVDVLERLAGQLAKSGFWADSKRPEEALAKILVGRDLGVSATQALSCLHVVKGRVVIGYALLASLVNRSGRYRYRVSERTEEACRIAFQEREGAAWEAIGESSFTMDEAKRAGLLTNPSWKSYPADMLFARAMSRGVRTFCPDVVGGSVYVQGEIPEDTEPTPVNITPLPRALPEPEPFQQSAEETEWSATYAALRSAIEAGVARGKLQKGDGEVIEGAICRALKVSAITETDAASLGGQVERFLAFLERPQAEVEAELIKRRERHAEVEAELVKRRAAYHASSKPRGATR